MAPVSGWLLALAAAVAVAGPQQDAQLLQAAAAQDPETALYALSAFAVNRVFAFIEKKARIPGFIVAGTGGGH